MSDEANGAQPPKKPETVKVKVLRGLYPPKPPAKMKDARGVKCMPGSIVELPFEEAQRLKDAGVVEPILGDAELKWITRAEYAAQREEDRINREKVLYAQHYARAMMAKELGQDEASL